jgi:hypothetical protein
MPCVGFEPTIPASKRTKTVHVLDHSATLTGQLVGIEVERVKHSAILYKLILHNVVYLRVPSITQEYIVSKNIINCVFYFYCLHDVE